MTIISAIFALLLSDLKVKEIELDFSKAFSKDDEMLLNEFPLGGAYCHFNKLLYFTGGEEYIKGAGKVFLQVLLNNKDSDINILSLPKLINSHWNHSMIGYNNQLFVIFQPYFYLY